MNKEQSSEKTERIKRMSISSIMPTHSNHTGTITVNVVGSNKPIEFIYHVPDNLSEILLKAIDSGFSNRLSIAGAGIKDVEALVTKLEKEVEALTAGKFATRTAATRTEFSDIIHAYVLSELADNANLDVMTHYQAIWDNLTREEKTTLRSSSKVRRQLNDIDNARIDAEELIATLKSEQGNLAALFSSEGSIL